MVPTWDSHLTLGHPGGRELRADVYLHKSVLRVGRCPTKS